MYHEGFGFVNNYYKLTFIPEILYGYMESDLKTEPGDGYMDEIRQAKAQVREEMADRIASFSPEEISAKTKAIEERLFDFANFIEAKIPLLYVSGAGEVDTGSILKQSAKNRKIIILPHFGNEKFKLRLMKVDDLKKDMKVGAGGLLEPDPKRCKTVPLECVDIALVPGIALDEKGGRLGTGTGNYDRLIPKLPITTRKVALAFEEQIISQVPMESHDKYVDIIVTDKRVIYKI